MLPRFLLRACLALLLVSAAGARPLSNKDAFELYVRTVQLMESSAAAVPDLARASAPLTEGARQSLDSMRAQGRQHAALTYAFLTQVRAYLTLSDAMPKPAPLPEEAARQFAELRAAALRVETNFRELLDQREREALNPDRDALGRYAEANAKLPPPQAAQPRVVFLGDSITDMWRLNEYFPGRDFVNRGISGQITGQMLGRMKNDVLDLKPAAMIVLAGTNDIARGVPLPVVESNLALIAALAETHHITPLFASVLPVSDYSRDANPDYARTQRRPPETIRKLNAWLQDFCRQHNYAYVDYYTPLADPAGLLRVDAADDGLHPNSTGYRLMAPLAASAIDAALAARPKGKKRK